ncbi:TetR family transcriptional regulator [Corticibacter populi]|uniref:TetR family transcriptional regulator n=1 Tax=Corticibacter populi TaxID=1550736 RepID=A0A3M6QT31_9BURK|nr:TetR family transcriptional regulator [Corticibacter populi]RMX05632.1 TetR family transcriptional regulator [Corticibacter populi]RZS31095.1 TetR family transcriptional regulator [Corticibacter populi]
MARRTKEEALETRNQILDAAERLFQQQGVSRTSLQAIASEAGITRGAIYWHFKDKADLFNAMMERIPWPIEQCYLGGGGVCPQLEEGSAGAAIGSLQQILRDSLMVIIDDAQVRRLLEIANYQIEYTEEMDAVRERMLQAHQAFYDRNLMAFGHPRVRPLLRAGVSPENAAKTMQHALLGLIDLWVLTPGAFDLREAVEAAMDIVLHGVGITPAALAASDAAHPA